MHSIPFNLLWLGMIGVDISINIYTGYCGDALVRVAAQMENEMKKGAVLVTIFMAVAVAGSAWGHGIQAKFGGVVRAAGDLQFELVNKNGAAIIYVAENHGEEVSTAGASGTLTVVNGTEKTEVPLQASGANAMETKGNAKLAAGAKATAAITFADKKTVTVNFVSK